MNYNVFTQSNDSVSIAATTSTGGVALGIANNAEIVVSNMGTTWAYVTFGGSSVTATTAGMPVPPGTSIIVAKPYGATYAAALMASGTATIVFTPGQGV